MRKARACAALGRAPVLANSDGETHRRLREVLAASFRSRSILDERPALEGFARQLAAQLEPGEPVDLMSAIAHPLPLTALWHLLGIPDGDWLEFRRCAVGIMKARMDGDHDAAAVAASTRAASSLRALVQRRAEGGVVAALQQAVRGEQLDEDESLMLLVHVTTAGNVATAFAIGNALLALAQHPTVWTELRADRSLLPGAIEECLRFESATHVTSRFSLEGASVGSRRIAAGRTLHLVISAANRDPAAFAEPDRFEIRRRNERQLSMGIGSHFCLGGALGRLEIEVVLHALLDRFDRMELVPGGYEPTSTILLRGPRRLVAVLSETEGS